jgi:hypothetical protein
VTAATAYDAVAIRDGICALGLNAEVDHSPIWGSPFKHVFVFMTEERWEGRYFQISPEVELAEDAPPQSLIVTERMDGLEDEGQVLDGPDELMGWLAAKQGERS